MFTSSKLYNINCINQEKYMHFTKFNLPAILYSRPETALPQRSAYGILGEPKEEKDLGRIITPEQYYKDCINENWAVGGFIGYNMEIMQASARAAAKVKAPVLLQASCRVVDYAGAEMLRKMAEACADELERDVVLHLDHGDSVERCKHCIDAGFRSVMLDNEHDDFETNVQKTKEVCDYAHKRGVFVEGEVFHPVPGPDRYETDVEEAVKYARLTGCDSLAVCCGNAHDLPNDYPKKLNVAKIAQIHGELPDMPLVLHATSILSNDFIESANVFGMELEQCCNFSLHELQESFKHGVCKVNSALDIKIVFTRAVREYMLRHPSHYDPRKYLGFARRTAEDYIARKHINVFLDNNRV